MALKLMAELGLDGAGFIRGLHSAEERAKGMMEGMKGFVMQAVGVYTVERALHKTVETATELVNTSRRLGVGTEQLQVLRKAAEEAGTEMGAVTNGFEKLELARQKALTPGAGGRDARIAFQSLGVGIDQLRSMNAAQLFMGPMSKTMQDANPAQMTTVMREIFGKGAGELVGVLKTDFGELEEELKKMGALMDTETAVKLKALGEEFEMLGQIIISQLGPALVKLAEWIYKNLLSTGKSLAGASAFAGAATSQMSASQTAASLGKGLLYSAQDIYARLFKGRTAEQSKTILRQQMAAAGWNVGAGMEAAKAAETPWQAKEKEFQAFLDKMAKRANELNNPPVANFQGDPIKIGKKALEVPSDSLTRVGNFLGGSQSALQRLAQRRTDLLQNIEKNTRHGRAASTHGGVFGRMTDRHSTMVPEV